MVPTWNEVGRVTTLLPSLAHQARAGDEIIVADGGSDDGTPDRVPAACRVVHATRGRARQQNAGAAVATGDVLWFLHADSRPAPGALDEIRAAIAAGAPGGCFRIAFPRPEQRRSPLIRLIGHGINARTRATRSGTGDQGIFVRRDVFAAIGGFPDWPLFEDVALFSALSRHGDPAICKGPLVTSARRWLDHGVVRTMLRMWTLRVAYKVGVPPERLARAWDHEPSP